MTILRYLIFNHLKYSIQRGALNLAFSICSVVFLSLYLGLSFISITSEDSQFSLNLSGILVLLIIIASLFTVKALFDLIDFKIHRIYYSQENRKRLKRFPLKSLVECPQCKYMCRLSWKTCPICHTKLKRKN